MSNIPALLNYNMLIASRCGGGREGYGCVNLYVKLEHPLIYYAHITFKAMDSYGKLIGMVIRECDVLNFFNKDIIFVEYPSHIGVRGRLCCQVCSGFASCQGWCTIYRF